MIDLGAVKYRFSRGSTLIQDELQAYGRRRACRADGQAFQRLS
jgi:hypothetical protein